MLDYLRAKDWLPVTIRQRIRRYEQAVFELENRLGRAATDEELAAELEISVKDLQALEGQISVATVIPLDDYLRADSPLTGEPGPSERMEKEELRTTLTAAIERLPEKEKKVVALYYYEELTLKEISLILNLSEARISQLHTKAIFRMRGYLARMKASLV
jgi:RNA polymerase sigma factor for flagellar operon FliA